MNKRVAELQQWLRLVRRDGHILRDYPSLLFQQATNEPESSVLAQAALQRTTTHRERRPWFRWVNKQSVQSAEIMTLTGHKSSVYSCCLSLDGRQLISAGWDGVRAWNFDTGEQISAEPVLKTKASYVTVTADRLFVAEWDGMKRFGQLHLLEYETWISLGSFASPATEYGGFAISSDGVWMANSEANQITVSNFHDQSKNREFFESSITDKLGFSFLSFSADSQLLLAVELSGNVYAWDTQTWEKLFQFRSPAPDVRSAVLSPNRSLLAVVRPDGVLCYELKNCRLRALLRGHSAAIEGCCFSNDGERLVTWARDGAIKIWAVPAAEGEEQSLPDEFTEWTSQKSGYQRSRLGTLMITTCAFSPDGTTIAAVDTGEGGKLYDAYSFKTLRRIEGLSSYADLAAKGDIYTASNFSPDGQQLICGKKNGELRQYNVASAGSSSFPYPHSYSVNDLSFDPEGRGLLSVSGDRSFKLWDVTTRHLRMEVAAHSAAINACCFSPSAETFATAGDDRLLKIWSTNRPGRPKNSLQHESAVKAVAYSPDGSRLCSVTANGSVYIWDVVAGVVLKELSFRDRNARRCAWTRDRRTVIAIADTGTVAAIDVDTGEVQARFVSGKTLLACAIAPDAKRVLMTTKTGSIYLLELTSL